MVAFKSPEPRAELTIEDAHPLTEKIIRALLDHVPHSSWTHWYMDDMCIDSDSQEFFNVVDKVIREELK